MVIAAAAAAADDDDDDDDVQNVSESYEHMTRISSARNCLFRDGERQIGQYRSMRPIDHLRLVSVPRSPRASSRKRCGLEVN